MNMTSRWAVNAEVAVKTNPIPEGYVTLSGVKRCLVVRRDRKAGPAFAKLAFPSCFLDAMVFTIANPLVDS